MAVFVVGSVAANITHKESDITTIVVDSNVFEVRNTWADISERLSIPFQKQTY
ncbi:MAG: hypothetical protein WC602_06605 [archaeon]